MKEQQTDFFRSASCFNRKLNVLPAFQISHYWAVKSTGNDGVTTGEHFLSLLPLYV